MRHVPRPRFALITALGIVALTLLHLVIAPVTAAAHEPIHYVALGDSRAASPTVTSQIIGCGRSSVAYPDQLAGLIHTTTFRSVACAGAKAENITTTPQLRSQGFVPPQIDAPRPDTDLVTISIGGNDTDWGNISRVCFVPIPGVDAHCRSNAWYHSAIRNALAPLEDRVDAVVRAVRKRSPSAAVVIVGQGGYFGERGCFPENPASSADLAFIRRDFFGPYNDILRRVAERHRAAFVDVEAESIGHDACAGDEKWFEGYVTSSEYLGFHPNLAGNKAIARMIADRLPSSITGARGR
ncbi:SGNH/GDSL hydrolase family protein [Gordonia hankookensis]|uniref:SGNH/GDSL hydrolase family protein n=1 Tax=Gordonia hankookensis TaxID=589403 RepID=A0ABR7WE77_9ACTN|nr:SGNH/GDSL hydrolase family protein [Gordonia hankookensis]MBD1321063.1 SGNH/GDSL hydrolase family protein [Gordonia hankookensis]